MNIQNIIHKHFTEFYSSNVIDILDLKKNISEEIEKEVLATKENMLSDLLIINQYGDIPSYKIEEIEEIIEKRMDVLK